MTWFVAIRYLLAAIFGLTGLLFLFLAALGIYRLPDVYTRMHASTKASTLGISGLALSAFFFIGEPSVLLLSLLIILFFFLTAPIGSFALAEAVYDTNLELDERTIRYDLEEAHILCPVRGGPGSQLVNEKAINLARASGGKLTFLHVVNQDLMGMVNNSKEATLLNEQLKRLGETAVAAAQGQAARHNIIADGRVVAGTLETAVLQTAKEIKATIILLGYPVHELPAVQEAAEKRLLALEELFEANLDNVRVIIQRSDSNVSV